MGVDERRQYQRIEIQGATVEVPLSSGAARFNIVNLSGGGALIAGRIDVEPGTDLLLVFHLPAFATIPLPVRVVRHVPHRRGENTAVLFNSSSDILAQWINEVVLQRV